MNLRCPVGKFYVISSQYKTKVWNRYKIDAENINRLGSIRIKTRLTFPVFCFNSVYYII